MPPRRTFTTLLTLVALLALASVAGAHGGQTHGEAPDPATGLPAGATVLAEGLDNPRGLAVARDGSVYAALAGRGGDGPCRPGAEGGTVCIGASGSVVRISGGKARTAAGGLPSLAMQGEGTQALGPHDVTLRGRSVFAVVGLGARPGAREELGPLGAGLGRVYALRGGRARPVADLVAHEGAADPDRNGDPDSNPYSLLAVGRRLMAVDAGGNSLVSIGTDRRVRTVATFPARTITAPDGTPGVPPGTRMPLQAVPTAVVRGPDRALYVSELTGFPFPKGAARIWRIPQRGRPRVIARGFTNVVDLGFGPDGHLHVLEMASEGLLAGPALGRLVHVERDGTRHTLADRLPAPGGMAIDRRGRVHLSLHATAPGTGVVVRLAEAGAPSSHHHSGTPHGAYPDLGSAAARHVAQVSRLWSGVLAAAASPRLGSYAAARRAGYVRPTRSRLQRPIVFHLRREAYDRDGRVLDPRRPESLVFWAPKEGEPVLLGFMFRADRLTPPRLGGGLLGWHRHGLHRTAMPMTHVWLTRDLRSAIANCLPVPELQAAVPRFRFGVGGLVSGPEAEPCSGAGDGHTDHQH